MTKAKSLELTQDKKEDAGLTLARAVLEPTISGSVTIADYSNGFGDVALSDLAAAFGEQVKKLDKDDLGRAENLLLIQAHTLDAIFNNLARRAINSEYLSTLESYLKLGLKAQGQCRATLDTLSKMKNPSPVNFVAQANIAHGHQQVNNAVGRGEGQQEEVNNAATKKQKTPNELLTEQDNAAQMDNFTEAGTSQKDKELAAVEASHRG